MPGGVIKADDEGLVAAIGPLDGQQRVTENRRRDQVVSRGSKRARFREWLHVDTIAVAWVAV
jgi:hypothetical protein